MKDNSSAAIYLLSGVSTLCLILAAAWGKQVLERLDGITRAVGGLKTDVAVHGERLGNYEHRITRLEEKV